MDWQNRSVNELYYKYKRCQQKMSCITNINDVSRRCYNFIFIWSMCVFWNVTDITRKILNNNE